MKKVMVFAISGLGDNLLALPLLLELEKRFQLTIVVNSGPQVSFFRTCFPTSIVLPYDNGVGDVINVLYHGKGHDYWLYTIASCARKARLLNLCSLSAKTYGFTSLASEGTWQAEIGFDVCLMPDLAKKAWRNNLRLLSLIDADDRSQLNAWDSYARVVRDRLGITPMNVQDRRLFVHPGSNAYPGGLERYKRWPLEHFRVVVEQLLDEGLFSSVTLFLGPADSGLMGHVREMQAKSRHGTRINIMTHEDTRSSIVALARVIGDHACVLSNDTGVAHLAALTGVPMAVIMSGICEESYVAQDGSQVRIVSSPQLCQGCTVGVSYAMAVRFQCYNEWACMSTISPHAVINAMRSMPASRNTPTNTVSGT